MNQHVIELLIAEFEAFKPFQVENTIRLLVEEECTIPFIARYRKEQTGELDEVQIQALRDRYEYLQELEERKATILDTIEKAGKLTPELRHKIVHCQKKQELEDLYLPYRPKKRTRATIAREKGLAPLAEIIKTWVAPEADLAAICLPFIDPEKEVPNIQEALMGAQDILAEESSETAEYRKFIRKVYTEEGRIVSRVRKEFEGQQTKFEMYYDHSEPMKTVPSHRFLAMRRGERENVLTLDIIGPDPRILELLQRFWVQHPSSFFTPLMNQALEDGYQRLTIPSITTEIMTEARNSSDDEAIKVFEKNLHCLLLQPPGGPKVVLGVDPGIRTGCKMTVVDQTGRYCEGVTVFPIEPFNRATEAESTLLPLIQKHGVQVIAIGNGTASRETFTFFREMLTKYEMQEQVHVLMVNEAGASVYSASELAREEFPDLDLTMRGAISIARRFQDPLAELVKIEPKSIGVGQYQHDVSQKKLRAKLGDVVQFVVNRVGVELNSASASLLVYVSGISASLARAIMEYRFQNGPFTSRTDLMKIPRFGEKTFQQAAGFLRIRGAVNPLDASAVHPESYPLVERMAADLGVTVAELVENATLIGRIDPRQYCSETVGLPTLRDILAELKKPGRDPRQEMTSFEFQSDLKEITDLKEGQVLGGIVTNVTDFGAFVDIGVHQDGLVHLSRMGKKYIKNPYEVCAVGQKVTVKVIAVDTERKRISLSMKDI